MTTALTFAKWLDEFEASNPEKKFASITEACHYYESIERTSEMDRVMSESVRSSGQVISRDGDNITLTLEVLEKALTHSKGEFLYLAYAPAPDGSAFMDMGLRGGECLPGVLASYALTLNSGEEVNKFTRLVSRVLWYAQNHIAAEQARRAKNN